MHNRALLIVLGVFLVARVILLEWDSGLISPHPDERQVAFVAERIDGWFDDPEFFAYGTLHIQLVRMAAVLTEGGDEFADLVRGGRFLSVCASLAALALGYWLAQRAWGDSVAGVFVLLAACVPLDLQQSHFATVEAHHAFWVVAALAASWRLVVQPSVASALGVGVAFGASLAVKVASLPLLLPIAAAFVIVGFSGWVRAIGLAGLSLSTASLVLWIGQPWTFADSKLPWLGIVVSAIAAIIALWASRAERHRPLLLAAAVGVLLGGSVWFLQDPLSLHPDYLRGVSEQIDMVSGKADLPYVRVYSSSLPVLYSVRELGIWALGPALLVGSVLAVAMALRRSGKCWSRWCRRAPSPTFALLILLLLWIVPMALRLSTLQVKYLRYWQPLVVPLVLIVAWAVTRWPRRWRRRIACAVVAPTAVWGVLYLFSFSDAHPHAVASEWFSSVVSPGQVVAFEHWDEGLAVRPNGGGVAHVSLPSYDLPDDSAKAERWCEELAKADWVVLTSNRVRRTVGVNTDRFPLTANLYRLLLAGDLGFVPVTRVERQPGFLGLRMPVQTADESWVNYECPRVVVLRRLKVMSVQEMLDRLWSDGSAAGSASWIEIDRKSVGVLPALEARPGWVAQAVTLLLWSVVLALSGGVAWAVFLPALGRLPDAGVGLAIVTGWVVPPWIAWIGSELGLVAIGDQQITLLWVAWVSAGAVLLWIRRKRALEAVSSRRSSIALVVGVIGAVWVLFLVARATNPAIFWGEKPMDFSFLNAFLRTEAWPPGEPWLAGARLHYYYFGEVLVAFWTILVGAPAGVAYNVAAATIPALTAGAAATLAMALARGKKVAAMLSPVLLVLSGNLAWPWLMDLARDGRWFDMWWATSRVVPGFAIDEYPLWTALFADLHAHFIAFPVLVGALAWVLVAVRTPPSGWMQVAAMTGVFAGILVATNPWDLPVFAAIVAVTILCGPQRWRSLGRLGIAAVMSLVAVVPFLFELRAWMGAGIAGGSVLSLHAGEQAPAWAVIRHFGLFWIPLVGMALVQLSGWVRRDWRLLGIATSLRDRVARAALFRFGGRVGLVGALAVAAGVPGWLHGSGAAMVALPLSLLLAGAAVQTSQIPVRLAWVGATVGALFVAVCEWLTLIDRMNTLFKIYNGVWLVLAIATVTVLTSARETALKRVGLGLWLPLQLIAFMNLPLGVIQGWVQPRIDSPRPTLDGSAYLSVQDSQTDVLSRSIRAMAVPGEVVAEAAGPSYREFTRIAMHTGQPTVVGWQWHLQQRGQDLSEINQRFADLSRLYATPNPLEQIEVLDRYEVDWVVLADVEREAYGIVREDPFEDVVSVHRILGRDGVALYKVLRDPEGRN